MTVAPTARRRRGMTLIELAAVTSVMALLLPILATIVVRLVRVEQSIRHHPSQIQAQTRWASQLRQDVRAAAAARIEAAEGSSRLQLECEDGSRIDYLSHREAVDRVAIAARDTTPQHRETLHLARGTRLAWSISEPATPVWVQATLIDDVSQQERLRVLVQLGRDRRWALPLPSATDETVTP